MLTFTAELIVDFVCACAGGALVWHYKERFQTWWRGAEATAANLKADAAALEAKLAAAKAAVKS